MAWGGNVCPDQFKLDLLLGVHVFGTDGMKVVLYDNTVTPATSATAYAGAGSETGELATSGGYTQGGAALSTTATFPKVISNTAVMDWTDPAWGPPATFTAYGCSIYNDNKSDKYVGFFDFGGAKQVTAGTFTIVMPTADQTTGVLRLG